MIVRGVLEDFPKLKIVASHGGGGICETISRMDYAYEMQDEAFFLGSYAPMKIKHAPSHYLKMLYLDTVTYNPPAVKMVLEWMGPDRVLYGSDAPPLTSLKPRAIKLIQDLDIPAADKEKIFWSNARRLLKLELNGAPMKTLTLLFAAATAIALAAPSPASAQAYPSKPIRVITANSAGGTSDIFVRALGDELQKRLGQPIVVENRSGGGMNIAGRACAEAANDGYNICILPNEVLTLNEFTFKSIPYNPEKDFDPITNCFINTQVLVVSSALGVNSLGELAALSKARPGTLSYSVLAIPMQITFENWKKKTGADIVSVPSRGGSDMVTGLLTGTMPIAIVGLPNFIPHIRSGAVKAMAVDSEARSPLFPDVPTLKELGFPNLAPVYFGFVAPTGTPKDMIHKLHDEIVAIGNEPSFRQKRLIDIGIVPVFDTPGHFADYLKVQRDNGRKLIQKSGFQPR